MRDCKRLGGMHFFECRSLERIILPSTLTEIDKYAFLRCSGLKEVVVVNKSRLQQIGKKAFSNYKSLLRIDLSNTFLTKIPFETFAQCTNLKRWY